jgi:hypothetical protein
MRSWEKATAKAKFRDLSTAAAKAPPSVEMTVLGGWERRKQIPFGDDKLERQVQG